MMPRKYKGWSPKQRKAFEKTIAKRKKEKAALEELQGGKRYGPVKATAVRVIHDRPARSMLTIAANKGSLERIDDDPPHETVIQGTANGYVDTRSYDDLLQRFHMLQEELADRDVTIAKLQLELAEAKRGSIHRANVLGLTYKKD